MRGMCGARNALIFDRTALLRVILLVCCALLAGCETLGYAWQATRGHLALMAAREPVADVIADQSTPEWLRRNLQSVQQLRDFAGHTLGFSPVSGFDSWVALNRDYPVWNVVAAPALSVQPVQWCFPVAGCVSYRGYFKQADAERFASNLDLQGYDTWVYGVAAYSTLGWFEDPVLSSWIDRSPEGLAALVFHELAHQQFYAKDDTALSEGYARVVEREAVRRWLQAQHDPEALGRYLNAVADDRVFETQLLALRERLDGLYNEALHPDRLLQQKRRVFAEFKVNLADTARMRPGLNRYSRWFEGELNNAHLVGAANYSRHVDALEQLLTECARDFVRFTQAIQALASLPSDERSAALDKLRDLEVESGNRAKPHR